jgi:hypothetical protein
MNDLTKKIMCLKMRGDIEIWLEKERLDDLMAILETQKENRFIRIDEQIINTADIVGIFTPKTMESMTRRKNGQWECKYGNWHEKREPCECSMTAKDGSVFVSGAGWIHQQ